MDVRVPTHIGSAGGSENPIIVDNIAYNPRDGMEIEVTLANQVKPDELVNENTTNPIHTGYDDFSSLRSRVPMNPQNSVGGSENPFNASAISTYENVAGGVMYNVDNVACDADQVSTQVDRNKSLREYDDFSSLRSRLDAQMRGSDESPITTYENITEEGMTDERAPHATDGANQSSTAPENTTIQTGCDDFVSLRSRATAHTMSSVRNLNKPVTTAEAGATEERVTPAAEETDSVAHDAYTMDLAN